MGNVPPAWLAKNTLLSVLPGSSLALLDTHIEPVECDLRRVLASAGETMKFVFFPTAGCVSMIRRLVDGRGAEVGLVGREGMVGLPVLLGNEVSYVDALIQAPGTMLRISADTFRRVCREDPALHQHLLRYALAFQNLTTQSAVCNSNHALEQRAARWLLMMHDRADGDDSP
jgi:CRP-like cAMP-binding protein